MAENITSKLSYDWNKLELANVARQYLEQDLRKGSQDSPLAKKTLEFLLDDIGQADPGILKTITDPSVIRKTIQNELEIYSEGYKDVTVRDRLDYHKDSFERYAGENADALKGELAPHLDRKYSDIQQEIVKASHLLEGAKKGIDTSKEDKEAAEKVLEMYNQVSNVIHILEEKRESQNKARIEDAYYQEMFKEMSQKPESDE